MNLVPILESLEAVQHEPTFNGHEQIPPGFILKRLKVYSLVATDDASKALIIAEIQLALREEGFASFTSDFRKLLNVGCNAVAWGPPNSEQMQVGEGKTEFEAWVNLWAKYKGLEL